MGFVTNYIERNIETQKGNLEYKNKELLEILSGVTEGLRSQAEGLEEILQSDSNTLLGRFHLFGDELLSCFDELEKGIAPAEKKHLAKTYAQIAKLIGDNKLKTQAVALIDKVTR